MSTSETPLSDLIDVIETDPEGGYDPFVREFRRSKIGVVAEGAPQGVVGTVQSTEENPLHIGGTKDPDGRRVLLAFADPPAFIKKFGQIFNAEMSGESLFHAVLATPDCSGIRVNSAKREVSMILSREDIQELTGTPAVEIEGRKESNMRASSVNRLAAVLAFVAAALAASALIIHYVRHQEVKWELLFASLFLVAMGSGMLFRKDGGSR
jgi:hypothetical protein